MTEAEIYDALQKVINSVFRRDDIVVRPEMTARDVPGWDSFRHISLVMATEDHFGIEFSDVDLDSMNNLGDFARVIARRTAIKS